MLDHCSISHKGPFAACAYCPGLLTSGLLTGGAVLWSRSFTPSARTLAASAQSPVNSLIREALIEGRTSEEKYDKDGYAIKWTFLNEMELIFVVCREYIYPEPIALSLSRLPTNAYSNLLTSMIFLKLSRACS